MTILSAVGRHIDFFFPLPNTCFSLTKSVYVCLAHFAVFLSPSKVSGSVAFRVKQDWTFVIIAKGFYHEQKVPRVVRGTWPCAR
jgi:hypothetical protein